MGESSGSHSMTAGIDISLNYFDAVLPQLAVRRKGSSNSDTCMHRRGIRLHFTLAEHMDRASSVCLLLAGGAGVHGAGLMPESRLFSKQFNEQKWWG
eukprot:2566498-Amphidinium_carterae.1